MIQVKYPRKDPRCLAHGVPVEIIVPLHDIGNAYGERWICPICVEEPERITYH